MFKFNFRCVSYEFINYVNFIAFKLPLFKSTQKKQAIFADKNYQHFSWSWYVE